MFVLLIIFISLISCEFPQDPATRANEEAKTATTIKIEQVDTSLYQHSEHSFSKIERLSREYIDSSLVDSILLLDMKSGITQKEFDRIIVSKGITSKKTIENGKTYTHYEYKPFDLKPSVYCRVMEEIHDTCGLAGFEVEFLIKNDTTLNRLSQELIDWGNGADKEGDKKLVFDLITEYQNSIIRDYKYKYGEPTIEASKDEVIVWFIGRKKIELDFFSPESIVEMYEDYGELLLLTVFYKDLKLMKFYDAAIKKDYVKKLTI